jgi:hypothetical protein
VNLVALDPALESLDTLEGVDTLMLFVGEDERPLRGVAGYTDWRMCGKLSQLLVDNFFTGAMGDSVLLPSANRVRVGRIMVAGLGSLRDLSPSVAGEALKSAAQKLNKVQTEGVALEIPGAGLLDEETRARLLTQVFVPEFKGQRVALLAEKSVARLVTK